MYEQRAGDERSDDRPGVALAESAERVEVAPQVALGGRRVAGEQLDTARGHRHVRREHRSAELVEQRLRAPIALACGRERPLERLQIPEGRKRDPLPLPIGKALVDD